MRGLANGLRLILATRPAYVLFAPMPALTVRPGQVLRVEINPAGKSDVFPAVNRASDAE